MGIFESLKYIYPVDHSEKTLRMYPTGLIHLWWKFIIYHKENPFNLRLNEKYQKNRTIGIETISFYLMSKPEYSDIYCECWRLAVNQLDEC